MNLNPKGAFDAILRLARPAENQGDDPVSLVLLLQDPLFPWGQLRSAGEKALGSPFSGGKESRHFVMQAGLFTLMKTGPHTLSFPELQKALWSK
jgi:hypothetical protein